MKLNKLTLLLITGLSAVFIASCATTSQRRSFTQQFYKDSGLHGDDLKKVQFYLDRDVLLYRVLEADDSRVEGGKITSRGGQTIEEILIRRGTPGVLVFMPKDDRLGISFDPQNDNNYLMFGPNPNNGNRYTLLASDWDSREGSVTYGASRWKTPVANAFASLLVDYNNMKRTKVHSESPEGRTVVK